MEKNKDWLKNCLVIAIRPLLSAKDVDIPSTSRGRPKVEFKNSSDRTKRRRVEQLVSKHSTQELAVATEVSLRSEGSRDAANIVKDVTSFCKAGEYKKALQKSSSLSIKPYTPEEALGLFVDGNMTKRFYHILHLQAKQRGADIYPPYYLIKQAKMSCYPPEESISVSEIEADIKLQALLDHTVKRIVRLQLEVFKALGNNFSLKLVSKWGCDGSSGQSTYKQKFRENEENATDSDIFIISFVPLKLIDSKSDDIIIWNNLRPSSTKYCRPIKIIFKKETTELTKSEVQNIKKQIETLVPSVVEIGNKIISVKHTIFFTMVDGKICSKLSDISAQKCYVCGALPSEMNNSKIVLSKPANTYTYEFGLSSLHAYIRLMECLLHISYRLDVCKWQIRDEKSKELVKRRQQNVREQLRKRMGLLVDIPKPGSGTTNDGNTARRFFSNPTLTSDITGVSEDLIKRFSVILRTIACGYMINASEFEKYAKDTHELYLKHYSWYYMPPSVHKIPVHGSEIIKYYAFIPIGQLSEEAQEARNKDFKKFRERHSRKMSRIQTMTDVLHMLLVSSDPVVSSFRHVDQRKSGPLDTEVRALLLEPTPNLNQCHYVENPNLDSDVHSFSDSD